MINLLEGFGFNQNTRKKIDAQGNYDENGSVPENPTSANVTTDDIWKAYVNSLSGVPHIDAKKNWTLGSALSDAFGGAMKGALSEQWDKIKFWKGISERNNWSDGKNGKILFTAGDDTFYMKGVEGDKVTSFESSISKPSEANIVLGDKNKKSIQGYVSKLQDVLKKY